MTTAAEQASALSAWERREGTFNRWSPYAALALSALLTVVALPPADGTSLVVTLLIAVGTAGWIAWFVTLHPHWRTRRALMAVYYLGLLALGAVLVVRAPLFGFFVFTGYLHAYAVLPGRWRLAGVACTGVLAGTSQSGGLPHDPGATALWAGLVLLNVTLATAFSWFGWLQDQRSASRKAMVEQLAEANRKLEATVRENAGLHAQLLAQAREAGILDERQRMAREIHDTLAQGLTGIITQLEAAGQARHRDTDWQRHIDNAVLLARESLSEARRSVRAGQPEPLELARLPEALADLLDRWSGINGVAAELTCTGEVRRMHPEIEVTLLRTAQEALANVAKHANAGRVGLTLSYMEDLVTLDVRDDGVGFDPAAPLPPVAPERTAGSAPAPTAGAPPAPPGGAEDVRRGGFGLAAMRQRVQRVAGRLEIESEPGAGTAISATVPAIATGT
ncbi:sensor histidine kinase [Micromonospora sp. NPDC049559]|uniref:sensor histidine kinase n=1 Tax=Micromonospora sp. NPDC049559 TaxID=3155923 RepID=UPI0034421504